MHRTPTTFLATAALLVALFGVPTVSAATPLARPSDFDGDGYADLAIGAPGESIGSRSGAGMVNVVYGGVHGLTATGDQAWSLDRAGVKGLANANDGFGSALASADFDHDGRADLAIGVPRDAVGATSHAGAVNVLYGSKSGLAAAGDQRWTQAELPDAPEAGDGFGASLATGDFDHDGYPDLAIGAPGEALGAGQATGSITIVFGSAAGLTTSGALVITRADTGWPYLVDTPHGFGYALASGDLDGDGYSDLAVGAPASGSFGDDPMRPLVTGEVTILYGGVDGPSTTGAELWTQDTTDVPGTGEGSDWFGSSLATGDFDDDGRADLAIGVRFDRISAVRSGAVNVLYGTASGLSASDAQLWHQDVAGVPSTAESGDTFGYAVAGGDLDGDGFDDLAVGVPGESIGSGKPGAGVVTVLYGSGAGLAAAGATTLSQGTPGVPGVPEASDFAWDAFGSSLAIADYGKSRRDDLAVGVPLERLGDARDTGVVDVLYGRTAGISGVGAQGWSQATPGIAGTSESRDYFGTAVSP